jgi:hypothetical protein
MIAQDSSTLFSVFQDLYRKSDWQKTIRCYSFLSQYSCLSAVVMTIAATLQTTLAPCSVFRGLIVLIVYVYTCSINSVSKYYLNEFHTKILITFMYVTREKWPTNIYKTLYTSLVTIRTKFFNTLKLCNMPTECVYLFRMVLTMNSDCFAKQH